MERSADFTSVAARVNNLEQKFNGGSSSGDKLERLYGLTVKGAQVNGSENGEAVDPVVSKNEMVFEDDPNATSFYASVFGQANGGGPSKGVKATFSYDDNPGVAFYEQVFGGGASYAQVDLRFRSGGPLSRAIFGGSEDTDGGSFDLASALRDSSLSFIETVFGTASNLSEFLAASPYYSIYERIKALESRMDAVEGRLSAGGL